MTTTRIDPRCAHIWSEPTGQFGSVPLCQHVLEDACEWKLQSSSVCSALENEYWYIQYVYHTHIQRNRHRACIFQSRRRSPCAGLQSQAAHALTTPQTTAARAPNLELIPEKPYQRMPFV